MNPRLAAWVGAVLFLAALALLFLFFLNFLTLLILAIGLLVFVAVVAALILAAIVMIFAVPYYLVAKPAQVQSGSVTLEQMKER